MLNRRKLLFLLIVLGILGASAAYTTQESPFKLRPLKTFYVVAYYWGYVFYDENFNEIPYMVVNRGDEVEINLIPAGAIIRDPILSARERTYVEYENRTHRAGIGELPPRDPRISREIVNAHEQGYGDHGLVIEGYNVVAVTCLECTGEHKIRNSLQQVLEEAKPTVGTVRFIADRIGTYAIYCNIYCGYGHNYQRIEDAFIVI